MRRNSLRGVVALMLACAVLVAQAAPTFRGIEDLRLPPGTRTERLGQSLRINGVETFAWRFVARVEVEPLAAHFAREWDGLKRQRLGHWELLWQRRGDWLLTVQMAAGPAGEARGWIAAAPLFAALAQRSRRTPPVPPMLPRTRLLSDVEASDLGRGSRTLFLLSEQSPAQSLDFYRAHYRAQGFRPLAARSLVRGAEGGSMVLVRGTDQLDLAVSRHAGRSYIAIVQVQR